MKLLLQVLQEQYLHEEPAYRVFNVKRLEFYRHKAKYNHIQMYLG